MNALILPAMQRPSVDDLLPQLSAIINLNTGKWNTEAEGADLGPCAGCNQLLDVVVKLSRRVSLSALRLF